MSNPDQELDLVNINTVVEVVLMVPKGQKITPAMVEKEVKEGHAAGRWLHVSPIFREVNRRTV